MLKVLDLFSGIGGFSLGLERTGGFKTVAFCEIEKNAISVLGRHWPAIPNMGDVRNLVNDPVAADILVGGDPCPTRSRARGNRPSKHPDMSGWFLAVAARSKPWWVLRENVPAPDVVEFAAGLEAVGYRVSVVALDGRDFTGQSRRREFVLGCASGSAAAAFERAVSLAQVGDRFSASGCEETTPIAACLTAHPMRLAAEDTYCWEPGRGLRVLTGDEGDALQGFPRGWTDHLPERMRRRLCGNAVNVGVVSFIGKAILEAEGLD